MRRGHGRGVGGRPPSRDLFYLAAVVYAKSSSLGPDVRARAIRCLVEAARRGKDPATYPNDRVLSTHLGNDPEFLQIAHLPRGPVEPPAEMIGVVEPD